MDSPYQKDSHYENWNLKNSNSNPLHKSQNQGNQDDYDNQEEFYSFIHYNNSMIKKHSGEYLHRSLNHYSQIFDVKLQKFSSQNKERDQEQNFMGDSHLKEIEKAKQDESIKEMIKQIEEGSNKINLQNGSSIMVIGNTGSGKTTLAAYLANLELISKQDEFGDIYFAYKNQKKGQGVIGHNVTVAETTIPNKFGEEFWDCPGFQDSKGVDSDIVNAFYMKKIADKSLGVKFILVMEGKQFEGKGVGECRGAAIRHLSETMASLQSNTGHQLKNSILIVLTKVNPKREKEYYKKKLQNLLDDYQNSRSFSENEIDREFFQTISEVPLELFPIVDQEEGMSVPSIFRANILNALNRIDYSYSRINCPLSKNCISRLEEIIKYSIDTVRLQLNIIFSALLKTVEFQDNKTLKQLQETFNWIKENQDNPILVNIGLIVYIQSNIFELFAIDFVLKSTIDENEEIINFNVNEVIGGVFQNESSGLRFSDFQNEFDNMNMIIGQVLEMRQNLEDFNKQIALKEKEAAEKERNYLQQQYEQQLFIERIQDIIKHEQIVREYEREEENEQKSAEYLKNYQKLCEMEDQIEKQKQTNERLNGYFYEQTETNKKLNQHIQEISKRKNDAKIKYEKQINSFQMDYQQKVGSFNKQLQNIQAQNSNQLQALQRQLIQQKQAMENERQENIRQEKQRKQQQQRKYNQILQQYEEEQKEIQEQINSYKQNLQKYRNKRS